VLAALTEYPRIDSDYTNGRDHYYPTDARAPRVTLINALDTKPIIEE
jgi:hypothetical protein